MGIDEAIDSLRDDVKTVARKVAQQWPGLIEADDMEHDLWEWLLLQPEQLVTLAESGRTARFSLIRHVANRLAAIEKNDYETFSGNIQYGTKEVWKSLEGGVLIAERKEYKPIEQDILSSIKVVPARHSSVLYRRFANKDESLKGDMAVTRAVDALTRAMNRCHRDKSNPALRESGPGSRKAVSNAQGRYKIDNPHHNGMDVMND